MDAIVTTKLEMTKAPATNTELAPLSERLAQICRALFLMESTARLARLRPATGSPALAGSYKSTNQENTRA